MEPAYFPDKLEILLHRPGCFNCLNFISYICDMYECIERGNSCPCKNCLLKGVCEYGCEEYEIFYQTSCTSGVGEEKSERKKEET